MIKPHPDQAPDVPQLFYKQNSNATAAYCCATCPPSSSLTILISQPLQNNAMPSHGVVPPVASLRGAVGYFEQSLFGQRRHPQAGDEHDDDDANEEQQSLLQVTNTWGVCAHYCWLLCCSISAHTTQATHSTETQLLFLNRRQQQHVPSSATQAAAAPAAGTRKQHHSSSSRHSAVSPPAQASSGNGHIQRFELAGTDVASAACWQQQQQPQQDMPDQAAAAAAAGHSSHGGGGGVGGSSSSPQHHKHSKYDSLDYELIENTVYRTDAASRTHLDHIIEGAAKWTICLALGE